MQYTTMRNSDALNRLPQAQRERLAYIDFRLYFLGVLRRADLMEQFGTGPAGATRDIAMYRELVPDNLDLEGVSRSYVPTKAFAPLFQHSAERVLTALSQGFGHGIGQPPGPLLRCEFLSPLSSPDMSVLAPISRAIHGGHVVSITYHSLKSGRTTRQIVPLALVDTGLRWHVRAFDRKTAEFRDFVLTRIEEPSIEPQEVVRREETSEHDVQWSRIIELKLVPHPDYEHPEVVRRDYGIPSGPLTVRVRASNVGYMLRRWNIDCSPAHSLRGQEYTLWLEDPLSLYGASNAVIAPGYVPPGAG